MMLWKNIKKYGIDFPPADEDEFSKQSPQRQISACRQTISPEDEKTNFLPKTNYPPKTNSEDEFPPEAEYVFFFARCVGVCRQSFKHTWTLLLYMQK